MQRFVQLRKYRMNLIGIEKVEGSISFTGTSIYVSLRAECLQTHISFVRRLGTV